MTMKRFLMSGLFAGTLGWAASSFSQTQINGFTARDIGNNVSGSTTYNSATGRYTLSAAGSDIEGNADHFHFLHRPLSGNGRITAKIESVTNRDPWTKVGVMVRQGVSSDSANVMFLLRPRLGSAGQVRRDKGGGTESTWQDAPAPNENFTQTNPYRTRYLRPSKWLSAVRQGDTVTTYSSDDGLCWNLRTRETASLSGSVLMGIALTAHHSEKATANISNLSVSTSVPRDINANCRRAQSDGDLAHPTSWIVAPASTTWAVSTVNPDPDARLRTCVSGDNPFRRTRGAESPMCPLENVTHDWARTGYTFDTGNWRQGVSSRIGNGSNDIRAPAFWLRREVPLTQTQIDNLMFWGRWNNSVSIYVNGVLATNTYRSTLANEYHYLGLNDNARAALVPGNNVIAVRVECLDERSNTSSIKSPLIVNCNNAHSDFGITQNQALANLPEFVTTAAPIDSQERIKADIFTQYTKEMGAIGGTFAAFRNDTVVDQRALGWTNRQLNTSMFPDPIMRLASVDKRVTDAVIVDLYRRGILHPDSRVYGEILNVMPMPGFTQGRNVANITVEHLRTHRSGITGIGGRQGWQDEIAFRFDINASQLTSRHLARVYASFDACNWKGFTDCDVLPGDSSNYSSNGHALLRFVAEVATGMSFNEILADMGARDIVVSNEHVHLRPEQETGYMIVNKETRARWVELDQYLALSASASGLVRFFLDYAPEYRREGDEFVGIPGGQGGAMDGTRSGAGANPDEQSGLAHIWNSDLAGSARFDDLQTVLLGGAKWGSCNPLSGDSTDRYRIESVWKGHGDAFLNIEPPTSGASPQLQSSPLGGNDWESAKWRFIQVQHNGQTVYRIRNAWQSNHFLHVTGSEVSQAVTSGAIPTGSAETGALWRLHQTGDYFRIENVRVPGSFLNIESGTPNIDDFSDRMHSTRWYTCS